MRFFIFKKVSNKERDHPCRSKINGSDPRSLLIQTRFAIRLDRRFLLDAEMGKALPKIETRFLLTAPWQRPQKVKIKCSKRDSRKIAVRK